MGKNTKIQKYRNTKIQILVTRVDTEGNKGETNIETKIQKYKNTKIQKYKNTEIQKYKFWSPELTPRATMWKQTSKQKYKNTKIQKYKNTKIQKYKNTNSGHQS